MPLLDIVAFITARLADEERLALACDAAPWFASNESEDVLPKRGVYAIVDRRLGQSDQPLVASVAAADAASHIAMHDPASALRNVVVGREVIDAYESALAGDPATPQSCVDALERVVVRMAARWRDHPEYESRWAP